MRAVVDDGFAEHRWMVYATEEGLTRWNVGQVGGVVVGGDQVREFEK